MVIHLRILNDENDSYRSRDYSHRGIYTGPLLKGPQLIALILPLHGQSQRTGRSHDFNNGKAHVEAMRKRCAS